MTRSSAVTSVSRRATNRTTNTTAKTRAAAAIAAAGVGRGERPAVATATSATTTSNTRSQLHDRAKRCSSWKLRMTQSIACVSAFDLLLLVLLGAIWGASFLFIRVAAPVLGPIPLMDLRVIVAAAALLLYSAARRRNPLLPHRWRDFVVLGTLNNAIPFVTIATAELVLTASLGAILNATSPFFTVIVAAIWARARPSAAQVAGTVIGFTGVAVLTGVGSLELGPGVLGGIALALVGAFSYAVAAVYTCRAFLRLPPVPLSANHLTSTGPILPLPAIDPRPAAPPHPPRSTSRAAPAS